MGTPWCRQALVAPTYLAFDIHPGSDVMEVFQAYSYSTAAWLGIQAAPMLVLPKLILSMLTDDDAHHATDTEIYFCRAQGLTLLAVALVALFTTGAVPLGPGAVSLADSDPSAPYAGAVLRLTALFHAAHAVYCYMRYVEVGQVGYMLGALGYGLLASVGVWCVVFAGEAGHVSKRTGRDKRASGFPFKNSAAYDPKADRMVGKEQTGAGKEE